MLEYLPLEWYEEQANFLAKDMKYWQKHVRTEGMGFLLNTYVKMNLAESKDVKFILEVLFQQLEQDLHKFSVS